LGNGLQGIGGILKGFKEFPAQIVAFLYTNLAQRLSIPLIPSEIRPSIPIGTNRGSIDSSKA